MKGGGVCDDVPEVEYGASSSKSEWLASQPLELLLKHV